MSLSDFRVGLAGAPVGELEKRQALGCNLSNGDLYQYPNSTSTVDGTVPLTFRWNTRCPGLSSKVDLYLYEPSSTGLIKAWNNIDYATGEYTVQLMPRWWNSTTTALLQVNIVNAGGMSWATTGPPGPVWTVNYPESAMLVTTTDNGVVKTMTNSAAATNGGDAILQSVNNTKEGGISKGAIAAAVIVPILVIIVIIGVAVRFWRQREAEKRRRWSQALSSTSNLDWEKGARPGDRAQSILGRPSMSTIGGAGVPRASMAASSVFALENNMAGAGAGAGAGTARPANLRSVSNDGSRSSVLMPNGETRQSRISFAESARPERRHSRMSLGNDLRPQSAVFNLRAGSRSASDLANINATASPSSGTSSTRKAYATGSAIADDDEESISSPRLGAGAQGTAKGKSARKSILGLGGLRRNSEDDRNEATGQASVRAGEGFRLAQDASGSVDELRELEQTMPRRSVYSHYSTTSQTQPQHGVHGQYSNPPTPRLDTDVNPDIDRTEDLDVRSPTGGMTSAPSTSTVAYGPDQMLAVYAARAKAGGAPAPSPSESIAATSGTGGAPAPSPVNLPTSTSGNAAGNNSTTGKKGGIKILTAFGKKGAGAGKDDAERSMSPTISSPITSLPPSSAQGGLQVPSVAMTRQRSGTVGRGGQPGYDSAHSQ